MLSRETTRAALAIVAVLFVMAPCDNALAVFAPGDFVTYGQADWGDIPPEATASTLLSNNFDTLYRFGLHVGGFKSILFTQARGVENYMPAAGVPGPLDSNLTDPMYSSSGVLGGEIAALQLNVDFSDAALIGGASVVPFGDLVLSNVGDPTFNGLSVRLFLSKANTALGGSAPGSNYAALQSLTGIINNSFFNGPSAFAQDHLRLGPYFTDGDFITYPQASWGNSNPAPTNGAGQLLAHYAAVYPFLSGPFEVGRPGVSTFSIAFTDAGSVINYLPASGPDGPLTSDVINPVTTAAGGFGGEVTALNLNVDFSDAHFTLGSRGIPFGDLELHDTETIYDGLSVRGLLDKANSSLGGSSAFPNIAGLNLLVEELNAAFDGGHVSPWARTYLRVAAGITGDYNANGIVDTADYVMWRKNLNRSVTLNGDTTPGVVNTADYHVWRANYGRTSASGASISANAVIPEPTTLVLLILAYAGWYRRGCRLHRASQQFIVRVRA